MKGDRRCRGWAGKAILVGMLLAAFSLGLFPQAFGAAGVIEEIVVTARQRTESLQEAPVTASALSSDDIERLAINNLQELGQIMPDLRISYDSSGASSSVFLRGIGTGSGSAAFSSAVGILIDDVHFERGRWVQQGFFDMEQVEVLKGPQALYFGKNNTAGLILVRTRDPGDRLEANLSAGYEANADEILLEGGVSIPVTDTLAFRLAGRVSDQDGWLENTAREQVGVDPLGFVIPGASGETRDLPGTEETLGRLTAVWTPTERLTARLKTSIAHNEDDGVISRSQLVQCFGPGGTAQLVNGVPSPNEDCRQNFKHSHGNAPAALLASEPSEFGNGETFSEYDAYYASLRLDYELDRVAFTSVTAMRHYETELTGNSTFAGDGQLPFYEATDWDNFSQEVRFYTQFSGPWNILGGVVYNNTDLFFRNSARIAPLPPDSQTGRLFTWDKEADDDGESYSVYAEVTWDITPAVELSGGARYTEEKREFAFRVPFLHEILNGVVFTDDPFSGKFEDDNVSPQITLSWRPNDDLMLFAGYREGFKSGGFDASHLPTPGATIDNLSFKSEEASGVEIGIKSGWLDGSLQANATAYSFTYENLQVQQLDTETTNFIITNAAEATTEGVELDLVWALSPALTLRSSIYYNVAEYDEFLANCYAGQSVAAGCNQIANPATGRFTAQDLGGAQLVAAPKWATTSGFSLESPLFGTGWSTSVSVDARYSDDYLTAAVPDATDGDYVIFDAAVRAFSPDQRWSISLIGRNLGNQDAAISGGERPLTGGGQGSPAGSPALQRADFYHTIQRGRQIWLQAAYRFGQ